MQAVIEFPTTENVHHVRRFLELSSYFRRFIQDFTIKAKPLTVLTKKCAQCIWESEQENAFQALRHNLTQDPVLVLYDSLLEIQLHQDSIKWGYGSVS